ncbi:MAG: 2-amino-4-oxopentanoate thiolase subunit OrtB [Defluviitaleaceae bacterium]|nr:2-amino-4-oxopentanoate thiolase subunit OrtB [Defluviitaleaceae bacterium]
MMKNNSYADVMARKADILRHSLGIDFAAFEQEHISFDYEAMMSAVGLSLDEITAIQRHTGVGDTPMWEMHNITSLARSVAKSGFGARIFIKDEAANPSGSFKDRRASIAVHTAKKLGFKGVAAATSGNYGAAVASQAAKAGLKCIIVQETYDSRKVGQPEILEKTRKCEAFGAEVIQMTVGPELFYKYLTVLEETGFFAASLYSPFGIAGVETLGAEIARQTRQIAGKDPDVVVTTHAGGGNITGTARGLYRENCRPLMIGASVNLKGLHMASDGHFNRKSFTTGHTGFGVPFATNPDRSDMPRSAARPLRYMDKYVTVSQGEVFYMTQLLAQLEGLERGPAGNTSLAAAFAIAQTLPQDAIVVVQETEYTGAGKHINSQLSFARQNGIEIVFGDPADEVAGKNIILPQEPSLIAPKDVDMDYLRKSLIRNNLAKLPNDVKPTEQDIEFLAQETNLDTQRVAQFCVDIVQNIV